MSAKSYAPATAILDISIGQQFLFKILPALLFTRHKSKFPIISGHGDHFSGCSLLSKDFTSLLVFAWCSRRVDLAGVDLALHSRTMIEEIPRFERHEPLLNGPTYSLYPLAIPLHAIDGLWGVGKSFLVQ